MGSPLFCTVPLALQERGDASSRELLVHVVVCTVPLALQERGCASSRLFYLIWLCPFKEIMMEVTRREKEAGIVTLSWGRRLFFHYQTSCYSGNVPFMANKISANSKTESFGLPYLSAYLNAIGSNFTTGANFATTIVPQRNVFPLGGFSPFSLDIQYKQLLQLKSGSQFFTLKGGIFSEFLPKEDYFSKALYTFDIGQNDIGAGLFSNMSIQEVTASILGIVSNFSAVVKNVYDQGGRSFWIHNTGPIGCLPYIFVNLPVPVSQIDKAGCAAPYNEVAQHFNSKLKEAVFQLRKELTSAAITYVDVYSAKYTLISQSSKYG